MLKNNLELNIIARQYNEKRKHFDHDRIVKELQCHKINSFAPNSGCNAPGLINDYDVPIYSCKFSPTVSDHNLLAIANENGTVCVENIDAKNCKTYIQTHNNSVFDLAWMPGEKKFVTVSGDHTAKLWDCAESEIKVISEFEGHSRSVKCVHFKPDDTAVFATGSRDGSLILWDTRSSKKSSQLPAIQTPDQMIPSAAGTSPFIPKKRYCPKEAAQSNSVTGLVFQNDNTLISSGSGDQCIRVWDMRKTYSRSVMLIPLPKHQLYAPNAGFSHICINPFGTKLYANCMDSYIYCFNLNSYDPDPISAFYGHQMNGSFYVKSSVSHDGAYLMSGSTDKQAYIWNTKNAEMSELAVKPLVVLPGHNAEVVCIAMTHSGNMKIATCSDDGTYRLWCPYKLNEKDSEVKKNRDVACVPDYKSIDTVRFQWRNKRKLDTSKESDPIPSKIRDCSSHSKICQFYNKNLESTSCICQQKINPLKRSLDDHENDILQIKRRCALEIQERTPPRIDQLKINETTPKSEDIPSRRTGKFTSKRKLADMPNFMEEESQRKKMGVLSPIKEIKSEENLLRDTEEDSIPEFSSPTANLPNYVKDGSSPYLHRCQRNPQKENIDWLTKLLKEKPKTPQNVTPENKSNNAAVTPTVSEKMSGPAKRKLTPLSLEKLPVKRRLTKMKQSPAEGKIKTLHEYFKTSEMNLFSQEIPIKEVEAEV